MSKFEKYNLEGNATVVMDEYDNAEILNVSNIDSTEE